MRALVQAPTVEEALLGVYRTLGSNLFDRSATVAWPYYGMTHKSVELFINTQHAETTARQQDELNRNNAVQASIPEETLRRLSPPTVQVPTDDISQVVDARNREMCQKTRDTLQATFDMSQYNLRYQARQSGLIGEALSHHNQGRRQGAGRSAAVTAQLVEMVNRLPNAPPQLITHIARLDQRTPNPMVDNRQHP